MKIAVSVESTADLSKDLLEKNNIFVVPFTVVLGNEDLKDDENMTSDKLYAYVSKTNTLPKTSAITDFEYETLFKKIFDSGFDTIIHISLSSHLSCACSNAVRVAEKLQNVYVIDSQSLSTGIGLLALSAVNKINAGMGALEIVNEIKKERSFVQASFVIDNLRYLYKGGRCSSIALLGANLLKIKPQIKLFNGKMVVGKKYRGKYEDVLANYVKDTFKENDADLTRVFITSSSKVPFESEMVKMCKDYGFKEIYTTSAGATVCSHCGPDTIGVLFINKIK